MKNKKMYLYVWEEFEPDYTNGLAFAIAKSEKEAKKIILDKGAWHPDWGKLRKYKLNRKTQLGFYVNGGG